MSEQHRLAVEPAIDVDVMSSRRAHGSMILPARSRPSVPDQARSRTPSGTAARISSAGALARATPGRVRPPRRARPAGGAGRWAHELDGVVSGEGRADVGEPGRAPRCRAARMASTRLCSRSRRVAARSGVRASFEAADDVALRRGARRRRPAGSSESRSIVRSSGSWSSSWRSTRSVTRRPTRSVTRSRRANGCASASSSSSERWPTPDRLRSAARAGWERNGRRSTRDRRGPPPAPRSA